MERFLIHIRLIPIALLLTNVAPVGQEGFNNNLISRRVKELQIQRLSLEELLNPGQKYLAAVKGEGVGDLRAEELDTPEIGPQEVLVVPFYAGVCGTDIIVYKNERQVPPGPIGHEVVAQVIKVGREVQNIKEGDIVTVNPNNPVNKNDIIGFNGTGFFVRVFRIREDVF